MSYHTTAKKSTHGLIKVLIPLCLLLTAAAIWFFADQNAESKDENAVIIGGAPVAEPLPDSNYSSISFGDIRGDVEPCGCDPLTDLGGLRRILKGITRSGKGIEIYSLGNNYPKNKDSAKSDLIEVALESIKPAAALYNKIEIDNEINATKLPYVLTNSVKNIAGIRPVIETMHARVYGYVSPALANGLLSVSGARAHWPKKRSYNGKKNILLFSGSNKELDEFRAKKIFDRIISSNTKPLADQPDQEEKNKPGILMRRPGVYMVPSHGQGLLLDGPVKNAAKIDISDRLFKKPEPSPTDPFQDKKLNLDDGLFVWLTKDFQDEKVLKDAFIRYNRALEVEYAAAAKLKTAGLKDSPFAGAEACKSCHAGAYDVWQKSSHAHALATLTKKGKDKDSTCVSCHVLGFDDKGGFIDAKTTPNFANVQCENCHGPRKEHIANPTVKVKTEFAAKQVCTTCHHTPHSSNFIFENYWPKIAHGK